MSWIQTSTYQRGGPHIKSKVISRFSDHHEAEGQPDHQTNNHRSCPLHIIIEKLDGRAGAIFSVVSLVLII